MGTFVITSKEKNPQSILGPVRWLRIVLLLTRQLSSVLRTHMVEGGKVSEGLPSV